MTNISKQLNARESIIRDFKNLFGSENYEICENYTISLIKIFKKMEKGNKPYKLLLIKLFDTLKNLPGEEIHELLCNIIVLKTKLNITRFSIPELSYDTHEIIKQLDKLVTTLHILQFFKRSNNQEIIFFLQDADLSMLIKTFKKMSVLPNLFINRNNSMNLVEKI